MIVGVVALALLLLTLFRQEIGRLVLKRTLQVLGKRMNSQITYQEITGDIFSAPRVTNLKITFNSDSVLIKELRVQYDILSLLTGKIVLQDIYLNTVGVYLALKSGAGELPAAGGIRLPNVIVRQLKIEDGAVYLREQKRVDSIWLDLRLSARGEFAVLNLDSAHLKLVEEHLRFCRIGARMELTPDSLTVSEVEAMTKTSRLCGKVVVRLKSREIEAEVSELSVNLDEIFGVPGRVWFQGRGGIENERSEAGGKWVAEGWKWKSINLPRITGSFNLEDSVFQLACVGSDRQLGRFALQGEINLQRFDFSATVEVESLAVELLAQAFAEARFSAQFLARGVLGSLNRFQKEDKRIDSVNLLVQGKVLGLGIDTIVAVAGYQRGNVQLRSLTVRGPVGNFNFIGVARKGLVKGHCELENFDLNLAGWILNVEVTGKADGELTTFWENDSWGASGMVRFDGFSLGQVEITNALVVAELNGSGPLRGNFLNRIGGRLAVGGEGVVVAGQEWNAGQLVWTGPEFEARFEKEDRRLQALGELYFGGEAVVCSLNTLEYTTERETLALVDPCWLVLTDSVVEVGGVKMVVADGDLEFDARVVAHKSPKFGLRVRHLNLQKVQKLLGLKCELQGFFDIDVTAADSLTANFTGVDFWVPRLNLNLKHLRGELVADRTGGRLKELEFVCHQDTSQIKGDFTWTLEKGLRFEGAQLDFTLADPGSWIFEVTKPYVEVTEGLVFGAIKVDWRPERLILSGRARMSHGEMKVPAIATTVEAVEAEMTFQDDRLVLEKLSGKSVRGVVTIWGGVDFDPAGGVDSIVFKTHFTGVSAVPLPGVYAIGGGDIDITWSRGEERPFISGNAAIDEALVAIGFGPQNGSGGTTKVDYDLRIRADRRVWLRNRESDIELRVDLAIRQVGEELVYTGKLTTRQGNIYYLDHILRVTEGKLLFENVNRFDPQLDITAELPINPHRKKDQPDKIILSLTGTLSQPSFRFTTEPPIWDETQILSYLSLNITMDEISALEEKELLSRLLSERLLGYFQTQVAKKVREFVSLDYLELETGILNGQGARVTVGKYVGRDIYVSYTQNFTGELNPAFLIEYHLNRRNELIAERSPDGRYSLRYRFKLRF